MRIDSTVEIAVQDILSFNLTETDSHAPRKMNSPNLSTKLKYVARLALNDCLLKSCSDLLTSMWRRSGIFSPTNGCPSKPKPLPRRMYDKAPAGKSQDPAQSLVEITVGAQS